MESTSCRFCGAGIEDECYADCIAPIIKRTHAVLGDQLLVSARPEKRGDRPGLNIAVTEMVTGAEVDLWFVVDTVGFAGATQIADQLSHILSTTMLDYLSAQDE